MQRFIQINRTILHDPCSKGSLNTVTCELDDVGEEELVMDMLSSLIYYFIELNDTQVLESTMKF